MLHLSMNVALEYLFAFASLDLALAAGVATSSWFSCVLWFRLPTSSISTPEGGELVASVAYTAPKRIMDVTRASERMHFST